MRNLEKLFKLALFVLGMVCTYHTHDNHARPFEVVVDGSSISISRTENNQLIKLYTGDVFIDTTTEEEFFVGNSILVRTGVGRCVFIGHEIYEFTIHDAIDTYYSKNGNNNVPYPVLLGTKNVYFMLDRVYVPRIEFPNVVNWADAYSWFYGSWDDEQHVWLNSMKRLSVPMNELKIVQKRVY